MSALIRNVDDMVAAWKARTIELGITYATVDSISGMADGYFAKLLCGMKKPGPQAIADINGALGIGFVVAVDQEQSDKISGRYVQRKRPLYGTPSIAPSIPNEVPLKLQVTPAIGRLLQNPQWMKEIGLRGNHKRNSVLSPWKRSVLARRAAKVRWNKSKEPETA